MESAGARETRATALESYYERECVMMETWAFYPEELSFILDCIEYRVREIEELGDASDDASDDARQMRLAESIDAKIRHSAEQVEDPAPKVRRAT
jgi:hypothetical protein